MMQVLDQLKELKEGEETIIFVQGQSFVVSRASDLDIDRVVKEHLHSSLEEG